MLTDIRVSFYDSMRFECGKSYCIEAASGIGKSSLLHFIGGFRNYYEGTILLDGQDIRTYSPDEKSALYRSELAYMFQDLRLFPQLSAYENVELVNQQTHFRSEEYIRGLFERLGVADKWDTCVAQLSWGQQQRVAFIRALCQPCSFLLLDEPISHLDDANARIMADIVAAEQKERHFGLIVTSLGRALPVHYDRVMEL